MKLLKIINKVNQNEISKFYNILTNIISDINEDIELDKKTDAEHFVRTFKKAEINIRYKERLAREIRHNPIIDMISGIFVKDGNCIMSRDWFKTLFEREIQLLLERVEEFKKILAPGIIQKDTSKSRIRDYRIYRDCVHMAFHNDELRGSSSKITFEELTILNTLKKGLGLSNDEARAIYFMVVDPAELTKINIDDVIKQGRDAGILFFRSNERTIYIPDEFVNILREIKGVALPDKYTRRILKCLSDKQINMIKRNHGIKEKERHKKIDAIISQGISIFDILFDEIFDENVSLNDKKKELLNIIETKLEIHLESWGRTLEDRVNYLIQYFLDVDADTNIGMSRDGYDRLVKDLVEIKTESEKHIRNEYEIQDNVELTAENLIDYNIKPKDVLYLLPADLLKDFCKIKNISYRGKNLFNAILDAYRESENIYLENYTLIANNDINGLVNNGVKVRSDQIGTIFENVTKSIFEKLGFNVNEDLRNKINTKRDKADIVLSFSENEIIIVECKSSKKNYSKFSSVSRQLKAYHDLYSKNGQSVRNCLLVGGKFTDDFIQECDFFTDFPLTLIEAEPLMNILEAFNEKNKKVFPVNLFRHGMLSEETTIRVIKR